jgi:hypothetical protein
LLIGKNVVGEVMGKVVSVLAGAGVVVWWRQKKLKSYFFVLIYLAMVPIYWLLVPEGNLIHQYYAHVYIFPVIILAVGFLDYLWSLSKPGYWRAIIMAVVAGLVVANGYRTSRYFYIQRIADDEIQMAIDIKASVPAYSRVLYLGQTSFPLALANRQGWVVAPNGVDIDNNLAAVTEVLPYTDYVVAPNFDGIFPMENLAGVELNLMAQTEMGSIYQVGESAF